MSASLRALLVSLGLCVTGCLELGGSATSTTATKGTSSTTASSSTSSSTTTTGTGTSATGTSATGGGSTSGTSGTETGAELDGCNVWAQDCPEGYKCMPYANDGGSAWNATKCSPVDPDPDGVGEPCTATRSGVSGIDSCDAVSMCWDVDPETLEGTCFTFCTGSPRDVMCPKGTTCNITADGITILCLPDCDPLLQDCPGDDLCLPIDGRFQCIYDASGNAGAYGDPCEYLNACDPGLLCLNPEYVPDCKAGGCCSPFCDTSAPNTCPGDGQECIPWYEEGQAPEGYENVGVCGVPQP